MDTNLTYTQLSRALGGIPAATIANNVNRNKLMSNILNGKKYIDINHPMNKIWLEKYTFKNNKTFDINRALNPLLIDKPKVKKAVTTPKTKKEEQKEKKDSNLAERKFKLEVEKLEKENRLKEIQIQKAQGLLIPFEAASEVFIYAIESYRKTFLQGVKSISNIYASQLGADHNKFIEIQKKISEQVQIITEDAKANIISGLDGVVREYSEVKKYK